MANNPATPPSFASNAALISALPKGGQYPYVIVRDRVLAWQPTSTLYCDGGVRLKPSGISTSLPGCWETVDLDPVLFDWWEPVGDGVTDNTEKAANYLLSAAVGHTLQDGDGIFVTGGDIVNFPSSRIYFNADMVASATGNVNLSNPGTNVFDGITVTNGQFVMCPFQTNTVQGGPYQFNGSSSAMTRATTGTAQGDFLFGNSWHVRGGNTYANHVFASVTKGITIVVGTTPLVIVDLGEANGNRGQGDFDRVCWLGNGLTTTRKRASNILSSTLTGLTFVCDWKNNPSRKMKIQHGQMIHDGNAQGNPIPVPVAGVSGTVALGDTISYVDASSLAGTAVVYSESISGGTGTLGVITNAPYISFVSGQTFTATSGGSGHFTATVSGTLFQQARSERVLGRGAGLISYEMIEPCVDINRIGDGITFAVTTNATEYLDDIKINQIGLSSPCTQRSNHTFSNAALTISVDGTSVYSQMEVNNAWPTALQTTPPVVQIASTFRCIGKAFAWAAKGAGAAGVKPRISIASGAYFDVQTWNTQEFDTLVGACTIRTASHWEQVYANNVLNGTQIVLRADYAGKVIGFFETDSGDNSRGLTTSDVTVSAEAGLSGTQINNFIYDANAIPAGVIWQHNNLTVNLSNIRVASVRAGKHYFRNLSSTYDGVSQGSIQVGTIANANFASGSQISTSGSASVYLVKTVTTTLPINTRVGTFLDGETITDTTVPGDTAVLANPGGAGTGQLTIATISGTLVGGHSYKGLTSNATCNARSGGAISTMTVVFSSGVPLVLGNSITDSVTGATATITAAPNFASAIYQSGASTIGQTNELRIEGQTILTNAAANLVTPITNSASDPWAYYIERGDIPLSQGLQISSTTGLGTIILLKKATLYGTDTFTGAGTIAAGGVSATRSVTIFGITTTSWAITAKVPNVSLGGLQINAWIDSANTLKYYYSNPTAGGIAAPDSTNLFEATINP